MTMATVRLTQMFNSNGYIDRGNDNCNKTDKLEDQPQDNSEGRLDKQ